MIGVVMGGWSGLGWCVDEGGLRSEKQVEVGSVTICSRNHHS